MRREIIVRRLAETHLAEAYGWHEKQAAGLGADFLNRFEEAMRRIALFPESGPTAFLDYRRILVRRFPYGVFHVIEGNLLVVAAVYHLARSPETMRRELKP